MAGTIQRNEYQRQRALELSAPSEMFRMMSTKELFYGRTEQTVVVKNMKGTAPRPELVVSSLPFYPDVAQNSNAGSGKEEEKKKKDPDVILYVPMCCRECEERIKNPLSEMDGVKSVDCNWYKRRVVVSGKDLQALPILMEAQTIFSKAAFWKDD